MLSGSALAAYLLAKRSIDERRREEGLKQLQERQLLIEAGNEENDPLANCVPLRLTFEQRLEWLEEKLEEKRKEMQVISNSVDKRVEG